MRLLKRKQSKGYTMEQAMQTIKKHFTLMGGKPYFRESLNKRKRLMNVDDFKECFLLVGRGVDDKSYQILFDRIEKS
jgi:hypothetical protein